jgi:hypothetical protein
LKGQAARAARSMVALKFADSEEGALSITLKEKKPGQRACDVKDAKGKLCVGHLKRWYFPSDSEVAKELGKDVEIYRCERCHALYKPAATDDSTAGQRYVLQPVNFLGDTLRKNSR